MQTCNFKCLHPPFVNKRPNYEIHYYCATCEVSFPKSLGTSWCICCNQKARAHSRLRRRSQSAINYNKQYYGSMTKEDLKVWANKMFGDKKK